MRVRVSELVQCTRGTLLCGDPDTNVDSFEIDTRRLREGGAFFALKGSRADGHAFLEQAAKAGAAVAVIERDPKQGVATPAALIRVESTEAALSDCGRFVRGKNPKTRWIAVTGSNGKTTTKELIAEGLSAGHRVHRTPGNFNNQLGVPLTLLAIPEETEYAVIELAMSGPGEIAELTRMTDPQIALVTNVRAVHMTSFQSMDDLAAAKGELFAVLRDTSTAVVNLDDAHVRVQASRHLGPRVTFGQHPSADLRLERIDNRFLPGATLTFRHEGKSIRLQLRMGGAHAAQNALAAMATVVAAGEDIETAAERMEKLEAGPGRGKIYRLDGDMLLVDDSYNCSPPALASVLDTLRQSEPRGRKVLVFGDMLELGPMKSALHREAGRRAAAAGVQVLVAVGPLSRETGEAARRAGVPEVHHHGDAASTASAIEEFLRDGDLIVVKGSRAMRMEQIVQRLTGATKEVY